jgi:hypothetical protein
MSTGGFKGFHQSGGFSTTVKPTNVFAGFPSTDFGAVGNIGGVPSSNLAAWFRPDVNITLSGSTVSQWQDTSGTYTFSQGTALNQPTYIQGDATYNGRPYLSFNNSNSNNLSGANGLSLQGNRTWQVIIIGKYNTATTNWRLMQSDKAVDKGFYCPSVISSSSFEMTFTDDSGTGRTLNPGISSDTKLHMFSLEVDRLSAGTIYASVDNFWRVTSFSIGNSSTTYASSNLTLACDNGLTVFSNVYIFDIFFYSNLLSQSDYLMLRAYMGSLYNF